MTEPSVGAFNLVLVIAEESAFPLAEQLEQKLLRAIGARPRFPLAPDARLVQLRVPELPAETRAAVQGFVWGLQEQYAKRGGGWETEFYPTPIGVTFMVVYLE